MSGSPRTVYRGKVVEVVRERWGDFEAEIVEHPDSVAVVAVDLEGFVTLVRQLRAPARQRLLELPAGKVDPDEGPLAAARRELAEETGLRGGTWQALTSFFTTPGFCRERMHVYLAEGVEPGEPGRRDDDEDIEAVRWAGSELEARLDEIEDGKTLVGLLLYLRRSRS